MQDASELVNMTIFEDGHRRPQVGVAQALTLTYPREAYVYDMLNRLFKRPQEQPIGLTSMGLTPREWLIAGALIAQPLVPLDGMRMTQFLESHVWGLNSRRFISRRASTSAACSIRRRLHLNLVTVSAAERGAAGVDGPAYVFTPDDGESSLAILIHSLPKTS